MPEILKFEERLHDFQSDRERYNSIMTRFDERLSHKAEKSTIETLYEYLAEKYWTQRK